MRRDECDRPDATVPPPHPGRRMTGATLQALMAVFLLFSSLAKGWLLGEWNRLLEGFDRNESLDARRSSHAPPDGMFCPEHAVLRAAPIGSGPSFMGFPTARVLAFSLSPFYILPAGT